jgi:cytochrome c oxidase assembly factor CtaG
MNACSKFRATLRPVALLMCGCVVAPSRVFAHDDAQLQPSNLLLAWSWEPWIIAALIATAVLYSRGTLQLRRTSASSGSLPGWQVASFAVGWLTLVITLLSPLHKLGAALFSAHMTQHELLMLIAAPLLVMGRPLIAFVWALPQRWRIRLGRVVKSKWISSPWQSISAPLAVWLIHGSTLWMWHIPTLYQATLNSELVHALQHATFLITALLFWFTLIHGRYGRMGYGVAVLYVFTTAVHTSILGALLTFAQNIWYPIYETRTAPWGLSPIEDQQLGGVIMWVPAGVVFIVIGLALFAAWLGESERRLTFTRTATLLQPSIGDDHA